MQAMVHGIHRHSCTEALSRAMSMKTKVRKVVEIKTDGMSVANAHSLGALNIACIAAIRKVSTELVLG